MALVNFPQTIKTTASYPLTHSADGSEEPLTTAPAPTSGRTPTDGFHKEQLPADGCTICFRVPNCCNCPATGDDGNNRNPLPQPNAQSADGRHREPSPSPPPTCETPPATALNIISRNIRVEVNTQQNVPPCTVLMKSFVGFTLVPLVVVKFQANPSTLFEKNPAPTWSFLVFSLVYCLIAQQIKKLPNHNNILVNDNPSARWWFQILNEAAIVSAFLSTSALVFILLPQRLSIICDKFWIVVILGLAWLLIYTVYSVKRSISQMYAQYGVSSNPPV